MRLLLYDVDSVIPNIALMKLSTYHKNKGDTVDFIRGKRKKIDADYTNYDGGYASVIFTKYRSLVQNFPFEIGGSGIDLKTSLDYFIEHLMPDYSLYPENEYSIGFTTRGCLRNCSFCIVPEKEGFIKYNADIIEFYNLNLKKIMLLDNNIFAYRKYEDVFDQIRKINKPTCFKQGLDFRLLTKNKAENLLSIKYDREYIFAYDTMEVRPIIERNMDRYRHMFKDWALKFYVLVGYDTTIKEDLFRIRYLKENRCLPFIMRHENYKKNLNRDFYIDLAAYCNQVWIFKTLGFEEYLNRRYPKNKVRVRKSLKIWEENWD